MHKVKKLEKRKERGSYYATDKLGTTFTVKDIELGHLVETGKHRLEVQARNPNYYYTWQWTEQEARDLITALQNHLKNKK